MADTIRMLSTLALKGAVHRLADNYEASTATRIEADFAPTLALLDRLRSGENADVLILTREGLDALSDEGRVVPASCVDLARSYVGTEDGPFILYRRSRFVSWLEDQLYCPFPLLFQLIQYPRSAQQHSRMHIMPAGMHCPLIG